MKYLTEIVQKFAPLSGAAIPVADNVEELFEAYLDNPNFVYIEEEGKGAILGIVYPHYWNPSVLVAQELGWWVEPKYRGTTLAIRLFKRFEQAVKDKGAKHLHMICLESLEPDKIEQIYNRLGYKKLERIFTKEL